MSDPIIKVINVTKRFGEEEALHCVNFDFERGKIYGIIGRNGSGKTVLFKCIVGLMHVSSGRILIEGNPVDKQTVSNMGIIIESPGFLPNYSAFDNLWLLASIRKKVDKKRVKDCIRMVGLAPADKKRVGKFSLGMRQRLGIAQSIMEDPSILILDEPMNGLDNIGVQDMRKLFLSLKDEGKTILIACHNKEDIDLLCDDVYSMDHGNAERMV